MTEKEKSAFGCPVCRTDITFVLNLYTEVTELLNCLNRYVKLT